MLKRMLSLFLCIVMVISVLPVQSFALETDETTEPQQTEQNVTGLVEDEDDADQTAAEAVRTQIMALPGLEALRAKPLEDQQEVYQQVQEAYEGYCNLSAEQQALLPPAEEVFKPYFDYFNSMVAPAWSGSGTSSRPYLIATEQDLRTLAQQVNAGNTYRGSYFRLSNSITLTSDWTPIGTKSYPFCGTFDGNNCTISKMTASGDYIGLFGYVGSAAVIKNLYLSEISMEGIYYVAGIAAYVDAGTGSVTISSCHVSGTVYGEGVDEDSDTYGKYVGGIAAYVTANQGTVAIENCTMSGRCGGDTYVGGMIGYGTGSGQNLSIKNCINRASIPVGSNSDGCGGIAGSISSAELESCMNYGNVSGNAYSEDNGSSWLGGITGYASSCKFTGCGNFGNISTFFAGGISADNSGCTFIDCLNTGTLTHSSDGYGNGIGYTYSSNLYINCYTVSGRITDGITKVNTGMLSSGEIAHSLRAYFGQTLGEDTHPVALTANNRVYKVTVAGEASGIYYTNYGKTVSLPELSSCTAYFVGDSKFDPATPITRDYALAAKGYHNYADGVCIYCGNEGVNYIDVGNCGESLAWTLTDAGVLKISGTGAMTNYTSTNPAPWNTYLSQIQSVEIGEGVTVIGDYAFKGLTNVTAVTLADTVTQIGKYAFNGMTKLASVTIGDSVTSIGDYAFASCTGLTGLSFGKQLKTIGNYAFYQCTGLESVSIPENVTSLGNSVFRNCSGLDYIWMGSALNLKTIGSYAFSGTAITDQSIPESVSSIGDYAFANCSALWRVTFQGAAAPSIAAAAFSGITASCNVPEYNSSWASTVNNNYGGNLTWAIGSGTSWDDLSWFLDFTGTLTISGSGEMAGYSVNYGAGTAPWSSLSEQIYSVVIDDGVTSIGEYAFYKCSNLRSVSIADSVKTIGTVYKYSGFSCAFLDCTSLTQITIPKSVTSIGYDDFNGCTSLTAIEVAYGNTAYSSENGVLYDRYKDTLYCYPAGKTGSFTIPSSVDIIAPYAFSKCTALQEITIPASVTSIGRAAFGSCKNLSQITFAGSAPTIEGSAFSSVTATVVYPYTDTTWTADMLKDYGGTLTWNGGSGSCGTGVQWQMTYTRGSAVLVISGSGAMDDYTADTLPWKEHLNSIKTVEVCDGVTSVGAYALYKASSLTTVKLADSVKTIGNYAFDYCSNLKTLNLGNGVQTIGDNVFRGIGVTSIAFPDSLKTIGKNAFHSCRSLKSVSFGSSMQSIGYLAFGSCDALETVDLGSSVTTLDQYAFNNCGKLKKIVIPASVTSIGAYAFRWCYDLQYVEFLGNAPTIGSYAFTDVSTNAYYVSSKSGWTSSKMSNYSGTLTWGTISQRGSCGTNAEWILDTAGNLYICGSGSMTNYSATSNAPWYPYRSSIKKVTLRGVTSIGAYAFSGCSALCQASVPATITSVSNYAFADCAGLQVVMFEGSAPSFGANAFSGTACEMWYLNSWSSSVRKDYGGTLTWRSTTSRGSCGTNAWWALDSTGTLVVIGTGAMTNFASASYQPWYSQNTAIKSVIIGDGITSVGNYAFRSCTALESVTISNSVSSIGSYAFYGCSSLTEITFLGSAPTFSSYIFNSVTATAYYPLADTTWTPSKRQNYGGTITWSSVCNNHRETVAPAVAATCTKTGLTEGKYCSLCQEYLVPQEVIPAKGHFVLGPDNVAVPADTVEADCIRTLYCTVCKGVAKDAAGHRVLGTVVEEVDPLTITNSTTYPFTLTDGTYYSSNKDQHNSASELLITAQYACSLTLEYGVSSESGYDIFIISRNGVSQSTISGNASGRSLTLALSAGDVVTARYSKDGSVSSGDDRAWVKLVYGPVMAEHSTDVPADTAEPDCTNAVVCRYCQTVVKQALGHRVIRQRPTPETPYTVVNTSSVPFVLTDGTYYSANHGVSSSSDLLFEVKSDCTLTFTYSVSSESYDKLSILLNGTAKDTISGVVSGKIMTLNLKSGDVVTVRYKKDGSVNQNEDRGWVSVQHDSGPSEESVPADSIEAGCYDILCDYCHAVAKEALGHDWDAGVEQTPATETTEGQMLHTCLRCSETKTEPIPVLPHSHHHEEVVTPPTCKEQGYTTYTCSCGDRYVDSYVDATGHTEVIDQAVEATCTADGLTAGSHCSICDAVIVAQEVVPAGHTVENGICIRCKVYGTCGENLIWEFDETIDLLTISGTGEMDDFSYPDYAPWDTYKDSIKTVIVEKGVTNISSAFGGYASLSSVVLPDSITSIGVSAFSHCSSLESIVIPNSVTIIDLSAFHSCINLKSISIPASVMFIDCDAFAGCDSLNGIWVDEENTKYSNDSHGVLFNKDMTELVKYPEGLSGTYSIPNGVITIGLDAFMSSQNLTGIAIPDTVADISSSAFMGCKLLKAVSIPSNITQIGGLAFAFCDSLESITFEGNVPFMSDSIFAETTATAYYPTNNPTWTSEKLQNYGGNITWVPNGKVHTEVIDEAVPPTCTEDGLTEGKHCSECGEVIVAQETVPSLGHSYSYALTTSPKLNKAGLLTGTCETCSDTATVTLPVLNAEDYQYTELTAPGCTENGVGHYRWNNVDYGTYQFFTSIDPTGHTDADRDGSCDNCLALLSLGDVNQDGKVDARDLTLLARHVAGIEEATDPDVLKNADVNRDGSIDAADLTVHARYVAGIISDWPEAA